MDVRPSDTDHAPMSVLAISKRRRTISWVAWGLWALILGLLATSLSLAAVTSFVLVPGVGGAIGIATMATAATLVITRWPRSRSGWLLLAAALSIAVGFSLAELAFYTMDGSPPLAGGPWWQRSGWHVLPARSDTSCAQRRSSTPGPT
jgi:hypothetical protein